jgi:uncharacterized protein
MKTSWKCVMALCGLIVLTTIARAAGPGDDVVFTGAGGFELRGTVLLPVAEPKGASGPFPAVLLLPGSGPTDRDGNQAMLKTDLLKQIAERLAAEGFASLRFDKRAAPVYAEARPAEPEELDAFLAWENFVGDARAGLEFLRSRPEINKDKTFIAGHSEGGFITLQLGHDLANQEMQPAGLVLLASAGRTLDVVLREQVAASLERGRADEKTTETLLSQTDAAIQAVIAGEPLPEPLHPGLRPLFNRTVLRLLHSYFTIDPVDLAKAYPGPVLIIHGAEDIQVSAERDARRLHEALQQREQGDVELFVVENASHNLKSVEGNPMGFTGPVIPDVLDTLVRWLNQHRHAEPSRSGTGK